MISRSTDVKAAMRSRQRGFLLNPFRFVSGGGGGDSDPFFGNVTLLMHGDGEDGQTTTVDSSSYARVIGSAGAVRPTLSSIQKKFGPTSMQFGGVGNSAFTVAASADTQFGTGDFTVECWIYPNSFSTSPWFISNRGGGDGGLGWYMATNAAGFLSWGWDGGAFGIGGLSVGVWQFLAVCRSAGVLYAFIGGVRAPSAPAHTVNYMAVARGMAIGRDNSSGNNLNGFIDDLRITKGVARYTADFTPPAAPFPNS